MAKISKDILKGLRPLPKIASFKMMNDKEEEVEINFDIHPFTVDEKVEIEQIRKKLTELEKVDEEAYYKELEKFGKRTTFLIIRKSIEGLEETHIDEFIPTQWYDDIYWKCMEHEGITEEIKKKITSQVTKIPVKD